MIPEHLTGVCCFFVVLGVLYILSLIPLYMFTFIGPYLNILYDVVFGWHHEFHFVSVAVAGNAVRGTHGCHLSFGFYAP